DPPAGPAALHARELEAHLLRHPARDRRRLDAPVVARLALALRLRRVVVARVLGVGLGLRLAGVVFVFAVLLGVVLLGGVLLVFGRVVLVLVGLRGGLVFLVRPVVVRGAAALADLGDRLAHGERVALLGHDRQRAGVVGLVGHVGLVGLD